MLIFSDAKLCSGAYILSELRNVLTQTHNVTPKETGILNVKTGKPQFAQHGVS